MFRIGEFSVIAQVSGRLLRYYAEIGLLRSRLSPTRKPGTATTAPGNCPGSIASLVLKELGLSLDQVARLVERHDFCRRNSGHADLT